MDRHPFMPAPCALLAPLSCSTTHRGCYDGDAQIVWQSGHCEDRVVLGLVKLVAAVGRGDDADGELRWEGIVRKLSGRARRKTGEQCRA